MNNEQSMMLSHSHGPTLALLTGLFGCRVAGQAMQRVSPQDWLPPFASFQGSSLPYWALLAAQLVILTGMTRISLRVFRGNLRLSRKAARTLRWLGGVYMGGALLRIAIGVALPGAPEWFSTWIPAAFHVVLAGWVLVLSDCEHGWEAPHA